MTHLTELTPPPSVEQTATVSDRRRPGRNRDVSPELIPLLRGQEPLAPSIEFDETDELSAARGVGFGLLLSAPMWIAIAYVGSWFLS